MAYTNSQILSAVLSKFLQPLVQMYGGEKLASLPFVKALENKAKSTGFVSGNWSLMKELSPLLENVSGRLITPVLNSYLSKVDDAQLPYMAHSIVDSAIANGKLELLDGAIEFEKSDLHKLKMLLNINLPLKEGDVYEVKETEDINEETEDKNG